MADRDSFKIILINETAGVCGRGELAPRSRDTTTNNKLGFDWATKSHCPQRFSEDRN